MKPLVINLPYLYYLEDYYPLESGKRFYTNYPLSLAYLLGTLKKHKIKFDVLDLFEESVTSFGVKTHNKFFKNVYKNKMPHNYISFLKKLIKNKITKNKYFLVAMNGDMTELVFILSRFIKSIDNKIKIVVGGHQATKFYPIFLSKEQIDFVIFGEGEFSFRDLVLALKGNKPLSKVKGLVYKKNGNIIKNPYQVVPNLDDIPEPYMDPFNSNFYLSTDKAFPIISSRGCVGRCIFCDRSFFSSIRFRNPKNVVKEIEKIKKKYKCRYFIFWDNTLNMWDDHLIQVCKLLIKKRLNIKWRGWLRGKNIDFEMAKLMKKAGCESVSFGVESGSQRILDLIKKDIKIENLKMSIFNCKKVGIKVRTSFIYNFPFETFKEFFMSLKFILQTKPDYLITYPLFYYSSSEIYSQIEKYFENFSESILYITPHLTKTKLLNLFIKKTIMRVFRLSYKYFLK